MSNNSVLTAEQRKRIGQNRKQALERLKARNYESAKTTSEMNTSTNQVKKILPKVVSSHRLVSPYFKPYRMPQTSNSASSEKSTHCSIELVNEEKFLVKTSSYDHKLIQMFKNISSGTYNTTTKHWYFRLEDYDQLIQGMNSLKSDKISYSEIPRFVITAMSEKTKIVDEKACLEQIEGTLVSTLLDFQKSGICFGISKSGRCMIADDMGLGKSRQALGIADFYRDDWPLLVVTNASNRQFWAKEIKNLLTRLSSNDIRIFHGTRDYCNEANVVICSYNNLQSSIDNLIQMKFGVIIFDESHNLKNEKAKQTVNAEAISKIAQRIIMLTGTPALSRPVELFTQLKILDNKKTLNYYQFTARYCNGRQSHFGWNVIGSSNLEELNMLLKKKFLIRRIKSEVFLELSNKNRELVFLENYKYTSTYDDEMQELSSQFSEANINHNYFEHILLNWYQVTSKVKAYGASIFVRKFLEDNDCKILVFCHHNFMMNAICAEIDKTHIPYIYIDGKVSGNDRAKRVDDFQTNPNVRAAVLSIKACNAGLNMTAASAVIFCEFDWNPSTIIQAEARAHRIGQENEVKVYFLMTKNTSDNTIWQLLKNKQEKLGKAGLVANIENLGDNIRVTNFDVQEAIQNKRKPIENFQGANNEEYFENQNQAAPKIDYFKDDDIDDEEMQRIVENLP
ncbi:SWI/SNF-related matrix-associated actin-dependent regulator of chromatin subfamily A-like protein 1 [Chironomus tepperi]|uniref:SWI/SNF-related matrix-associated actin-dependent regulator of chromatin subfamily A-like protein 1 n=1 Tax=Chironomus tepperi TaxID=113505 RepID=UPI00391F5D65